MTTWRWCGPTPTGIPRRSAATANLAATISTIATTQGATAGSSTLTLDTNVLLLTVTDPRLLARHVNQSGLTSYHQTGAMCGWQNLPIDNVVAYLKGQAFNVPVVVQTGLTDR